MYLPIGDYNIRKKRERRKKCQSEVKTKAIRVTKSWCHNITNNLFHFSLERMHIEMLVIVISRDAVKVQTPLNVSETDRKFRWYETKAFMTILFLRAFHQSATKMEHQMWQKSCKKCPRIASPTTKKTQRQS